jgi:hypothetical protein
LINPAQKFKPVAKDRLFYSRFQYCVAFDLAEVTALRELDHTRIDCVIERRIEWRKITATVGQKNILSRSSRKITLDTVAHLHQLTDVLMLSAEDHKLVTSINSAWVYTNDMILIDNLSNLPFLQDKKYTQALVNRPRDTIQLQNPRHQQRSYWRCVKLTVQEKNNLKNFFDNQPDIRPSPGLQEFFNSPFHRTQDYFFMDYNDSAWLTMIALIHPGLIRKTSQLISA